MCAKAVEVKVILFCILPNLRDGGVTVFGMTQICVRLSCNEP